MELIKDLFLTKGPKATVLVDENEHIYRARPAVDGLIHSPMVPKLNKDQYTLKDLWLKVTETNKNKKIFGHRPLIKTHTREKKVDDTTKKWTLYELGDYEWWTYEQAKIYSLKTAVTLQKYGILPGDKVLFFSKTSAEWMTTAQACFQLGAAISTGYDSMPADVIASIIEQTEPKAMFTDVTLLKVVNKALQSLDKNLQPKLVLYTGNDDESPKDLDTFKKEKPKDVTLIHMRDIYQNKNNGNGDDDQDIELVESNSKLKPSDLALIMFTSGSTGTPKGVELTHENIIAAIGGAHHLIIEWLLKDNHVYIGYLPLAHVLEFVVELVMISLAIPIGYANARTLMDDSVCGANGQGKGKGDLRSLQPSIMAGVPAVWERIKSGVQKELDKQNVIIRTLFYTAIETKWRLLNYFGKENYITDFMDRTIFAPLRKVTGGKLKYGLSGGAPISYDSQKFISSALCFMVQGYGLTECCGLASLTYPALGPVISSIGPPSPSIEFKLVDVEDTDYKAVNGIGELWLRGPSLMKGYYNRPDLTKEAITPDGWFKTGDIATFCDDGTLKITDRAKNLVKLSQGEYIALENLESKYRDARSIKNICLVAHSDRNYIIAIVEPDNDDSDKKPILSELQEIGKKNNLNRVEIVKDIIVTRNVDWMKEFATSSGKIKRRDVEKAYKEDIEKIYT
ncbi:unnamed protein product [Cunninghamella echinulata]